MCFTKGANSARCNIAQPERTRQTGVWDAILGRRPVLYHGSLPFRKMPKDYNMSDVVWPNGANSQNLGSTALPALECVRDFGVSKG